MTTPPVMWRKSRHSGAEGGNCVELADLSPVVGVRDSKNKDGDVLRLRRSGFANLVSGIKAHP